MDFGQFFLLGLMVDEEEMKKREHTSFKWWIY
jgi:hypothetical protein